MGLISRVSSRTYRYNSDVKNQRMMKIKLDESSSDSPKKYITPEEKKQQKELKKHTEDLKLKYYLENKARNHKRRETILVENVDDLSKVMPAEDAKKYKRTSLSPKTKAKHKSDQ